MITECLLEDARWAAVDFEATAETAARATLAHLNLTPDDYLISVMACDDEKIATLNADFRGKPVPTNVLSWPSEERAAEHEGDTPEPPEIGDDLPYELGDIAISFDTCMAEATDAEKPFQHHVLHLMVHGCLHLLGYDHIFDKDAALMEGIETQVLAAAGIPDPYAEHEALGLDNVE